MSDVYGAIPSNLSLGAGQAVRRNGADNAFEAFTPTGGADGVNILAAGSQTANTTGSVRFADSNGITFGMSNSSVITASHNGLTSQSTGPSAIIGSNVTYTSGSIVFSGSNAVTVRSTTGQAIIIDAPVQTVQTQSLIAGLYDGVASISTGTIRLTNANGVSFSINGQTLSASVNTSYAASNHSHGNPTLALTNLTGTTASASNGLTLSLSGNAAQTVQTQNLHNLTLSGNTAGVMAHVSSGTLTLAGGNNITLSQNGNAITISGGAAGAADGVNALVVNGGASTASTTLALSNSNNVSFGHNAGTITASASYSQSTAPAAIYDGAASISSGTIRFSNSNGVSFGINGQTITASHNGLTSQSNQNITAANGGFAFQTLSFSNVNGISFGTSAGSAITASHNGITSQTVQTQNLVAIIAGTQLASSGTVSFIDSNGVSFGLAAGSQLTASHNGLTTAAASNHSHGNPTLNLTNLSGTTASNSAGLTLSLSANPAQSVVPGIQSIQVSNTTYTTGNVIFSNANGLSFGSSAGGAITASHNALTTAMASNRGSDFVQATAVFNGTNASGTIASNGISVSVNPAAAGVGIVAGTRTATTAGEILFDNANGVSFGLNAVGGSVMTASHNGLTTARASNDAIGLNTAQTNVTWTVNSSGLSINASGYAGTNTATTGNISVTLNSSGISINAPAFLTTAAQSSVSNISGVIAGTASNAATNQTAQLSGAVSFANGSGVSFFTTASGATSGIAASVRTDYQSAGAYLTTAAASNHSHGNPTLALTNLTGTTASASNGLTLSLSGNAAQTNQSAIRGFGVSNTGVTAGNTGISTGIDWVLAGSQSITLSQSTAGGGPNTVWIQHPAWITTQSGQAFSAGAASSAFQTLSFQDSNGVSFSNNAGAIRLTHDLQFTSATSAITSNALNTSASRVINIVAATNSTGGGAASLSSNVSFSNANAVSFYTSAGGAIVASVNTTYRASNDAIGLNTAQSNVTWTVNSAGLSLDGRGYAGTGTTFNGANISGSITQNSNGLQLSLSAGAGGGVTPVASASNGSFSFTTLAFSNANNVTFGTSAGSIVTASVAAPGAAAENNWIHALGANTAGNTTASGSTIGYSGINLTLSGTNGSVMNISAPATSSLSATGLLSISTNGSTISIGVPEATASLWYPYNEAVNVLGQQGNATWQFAPVPTPMDKGAGYVSVDRAVFPMLMSNATNTTGSMTVSISMGLYTKNASSLSLAHSATGSFALTYSGTVNNPTNAGIRLATIPFSTSIEGGRYYVGIAYRSTTAGANATISQVLASQLNSNFSGLMGVASNRSHQWPLGLGVLSASSSAIPVSVAFSQIDGTASLAARPPSWHMRLGTV